MKELLYNKSEVVAALNKVEGFNPLEVARKIQNEGQEEQLYLDVKYRKLWFRLVHPLGKVISRIVSFTENMALVEARVYLDKCDAADNYIANSFSQKFRTDEPLFGDKFLELAETAAIGRALSDAGFGLQFADVGEENDPAQVDAGITVPTVNNAGQPEMQSEKASSFVNDQNHTMQQNYGMMDSFYQQAQQNGSISMQPMIHNMENRNIVSSTQMVPMGKYSQMQNQSVTQAQSLDASMLVEELVQRMNYEQAVQVVITGKGKYGGKTMGQVAIENPGSLTWFATQYAGSNHMIPAAARVILEKAGTNGC